MEVSLGVEVEVGSGKWSEVGIGTCSGVRVGVRTREWIRVLLVWVWVDWDGLGCEVGKRLG